VTREQPRPLIFYEIIVETGGYLITNSFLTVYVWLTEYENSQYYQSE
jgi:hypothetical protein